MKSNHVVAAVLWLAMTTLAVPPVCAADTVNGWYAGANLGVGRSSSNDGSVTTSLATVGITGTATTSNNDTAGKLFAGYQFNENFAMEGGYFNLGTYSATGTTTAPAASTFGVSTKAQGANVDLVGIAPFGGGGMSGLVRLGGAYIQSSSSANFSNPTLTAQYGDPSKNKMLVDAGLGLQFQFSRTFAGRLEWQRYFSVPSGPSATTTIDVYSFGMTFKF